MVQRVQLFDGEIIEFDDAAPEEVILDVVKKETLKKRMGASELEATPTPPVGPQEAVQAVQGALTPISEATGLPPVEAPGEPAPEGTVDVVPHSVGPYAGALIRGIAQMIQASGGTEMLLRGPQYGRDDMLMAQQVLEHYADPTYQAPSTMKELVSDPDAAAKFILEQLPLTSTLMTSSLPLYAATVPTGGLPALAASALMSRTGESLIEGGSAVSSAVAEGVESGEARTRGAKVAAANMPLFIMDAGEFATAFLPSSIKLPARIASRLNKVKVTPAILESVGRLKDKAAAKVLIGSARVAATGEQNAWEEDIQERIQQLVAGDYESPEAAQERAQARLGGRIFGYGFGLLGAGGRGATESPPLKRVEEDTAEGGERFVAADQFRQDVAEERRRVRKEELERLRQKQKLTPEDLEALDRARIEAVSLEQAISQVELEEAFEPEGADFPIEKAAKIAEKRNARRKQDLELFAETEDLGLTTPEDVKREFDTHRRKMSDFEAEQMAQANADRRRLKEALSEEEYERLIKERSTLPPTPAYAADFYSRKAKELLGEEAPPAAPTGPVQGYFFDPAKHDESRSFEERQRLGIEHREGEPWTPADVSESGRAVVFNQTGNPKTDIVYLTTGEMETKGELDGTYVVDPISGERFWLPVADQKGNPLFFTPKNEDGAWIMGRILRETGPTYPEPFQLNPAPPAAPAAPAEAESRPARGPGEALPPDHPTYKARVKNAPDIIKGDQRILETWASTGDVDLVMRQLEGTTLLTDEQRTELRGALEEAQPEAVDPRVKIQQLEKQLEERVAAIHFDVLQELEQKYQDAPPGGELARLRAERTAADPTVQRLESEIARARQYVTPKQAAGAVENQFNRHKDLVKRTNSLFTHPVKDLFFNKDQGFYVEFEEGGPRRAQWIKKGQAQYEKLSDIYETMQRRNRETERMAKGEAEGILPGMEPPEPETLFSGLEEGGEERAVQEGQETPEETPEEAPVKATDPRVRAAILEVLTEQGPLDAEQLIAAVHLRDLPIEQTEDAVYKLVDEGVLEQQQRANQFRYALKGEAQAAGGFPEAAYTFPEEKLQGVTATMLKSAPKGVTIEFNDGTKVHLVRRQGKYYQTTQYPDGRVWKDSTAYTKFPDLKRAIKVHTEKGRAEGTTPPSVRPPAVGLSDAAINPEKMPDLVAKHLEAGEDQKARQVFAIYERNLRQLRMNDEDTQAHDDAREHALGIFEGAKVAPYANQPPKGAPEPKMAAPPTSEEPRLNLLCCGRKKADAASDVEDLYQGTPFRKALDYAKSRPGNWGVISAKHGLIWPGSVVKPYDQEAPTRAADVRKLAEKVAKQLEKYFLENNVGTKDAYTIHSTLPAAYQRVLESAIKKLPRDTRRRIKIEHPTKGLRQGERNQWFKDAVEGAPVEGTNLHSDIWDEIKRNGGVVPNSSGAFTVESDEWRDGVAKGIRAKKRNGKYPTGALQIDEWLAEYQRRGQVPKEMTVSEFADTYLSNPPETLREAPEIEPTEAEIVKAEVFEIARDVAKHGDIKVMPVEDIDQELKKNPGNASAWFWDFARRMAEIRDPEARRIAATNFWSDVVKRLNEANLVFDEVFKEIEGFDELANRLFKEELREEPPPFDPEREDWRVQEAHEGVIGWRQDNETGVLLSEDEILAATAAAPYIPHGFGTVLAGPAGAFKSRVFRDQIINDLSRAAKAVGGSGKLRVGRMGRRAKTSHGFFDVWAGVVAIKRAGNYATAAHEFAHMIEKACFGWVKGGPFKKPLMTVKIQKELVALGRALYGKKKPYGGYKREGWAEAWRLWLEAPDQLAKIAPDTKAWIENVFFEAYPESKKHWLKARKKVEEWVNAGVEQQAKNSIRDPQSWRERGRRWAFELREMATARGLYEMLEPLDRLDKDAEESIGRPLRWWEKTYNIASVYNKTHSARVRYWYNHRQTDWNGHDVGPGLDEIFAPIRKLPKELRKSFAPYLYAKRAVALLEDPRQRDPGGPFSGEGGLEKAHYIVQQFESEAPVFRTVSDQLYKFLENAMLYAGAASPQFKMVADMVLESDPGSYVPLQRHFDVWDERYKRTGGRGATGAASRIVHKLRGSGRDIKPIMDTVISQTVKLVRAAHDEHVLDAIFRFGRLEDMGEWIYEIPKGVELKATRSVADLLKMIDREVPLKIVDENGEEVDSTEYDAAYGDFLVKIWGISDKPPAPGEDPIIPRLGPDGKIRFYGVNRELYDAIETNEPYTFYGNRGIAYLPLKILEATARTMRAGTTGLRASFGLITNPERDFQTFMMQTQSRQAAPVLFWHYLNGLRASVLYNLSGGSVSTIRGAGEKALNVVTRGKLGKAKPAADPHVELALKMGGLMVPPLAQDISHTARLGKKLLQGRVKRVVDFRNWVDFYRDIVQTPELAPRIAEMRAVAKQRGWDMNNLTNEQAMQLFMAFSEVTTNFRAEGKIGRYGNRVVPFLNASIQGPRAALRAAKRTPLTFFMRGMQMTAMTLMLWWWNKDKEWWKELDYRSRALFWHIPLNDGKVPSYLAPALATAIGGPVGGLVTALGAAQVEPAVDESELEIVRVPRAFEIGMFFSALPEALIDGWYQQDPDAVKEWWRIAFDTTNPLDYPPLIKAWREIGNNYDYFWQRPIESFSEAQNNMPDYQKHGPYTSRLSIELGRIFHLTAEKAPITKFFVPEIEGGISPKKIDHAMKTILGPVSIDVVNALAAALDAEPGGNRRERELSDIPLVGRQFKRGGALGTRTKSISRLYNEFEKRRLAIKDYEKEETEEERLLRLYIEDGTEYVSALGAIQTFTLDDKKTRELQKLRVRAAKEILEAVDAKDVRKILSDRKVLSPLIKLAEEEKKMLQAEFRSSKTKKR